MRSTRPIFKAVSIVLTLCSRTILGQIHALDTETPAYVDFEAAQATFSETETFAIVNVYRTGDFRQYTRVSFVTEEQTAHAGEDFVPAGGTLVFQPGEGHKQIKISLVRDEVEETPENFRLLFTATGPNTILQRDALTIDLSDAAPQAPVLQIRAAQNGKISLVWEEAQPCEVERSVDAVSWQTTQCAKNVAGNRNEAILDASGRRYLYRLRIK